MPRKRHRLAQRRKAVGLSQERLAEVIGVDRVTIGRWERTETEPQPWHRQRLARALKVSVEELDALLVDIGEAPTDDAPGVRVVARGESRERGVVLRCERLPHVLGRLL